MNPPLRVVSAKVPSDLLDALHERAQLEDRSAAAVIREALRQHLAAEAPLERTFGSRAHTADAARDALMTVSTA